MKKYIILSALVFSVVCIVNSTSVKAASISLQQLLNLQQQLNLLRQQLQTLQSQVSGNASQGSTSQSSSTYCLYNGNCTINPIPSPVTTTIVWCHTFNSNIGMGASGSEVSALEIALNKEGFGNLTESTYDDTLASAVSGFQEKYRDDILTPNGLKYGTGYVGPSTRAKLNSLYGCGNSSANNSRPSLTMLSPVEGATFIQGSPITFSWQENYSAKSLNVYITQVSGTATDVYSGTIAGNIGINNGSIPASVSNVSAGQEYQISICDKTTANVLNEDEKGCVTSGHFKIVASPTTSNTSTGFYITVISPAGGEILTPGQVYNIKWAIKPPSNLSYSDNYRFKVQAISSDYNISYTLVDKILDSSLLTSNFDWTVPNPGYLPAGIKFFIEIDIQREMEGALPYSGKSQLFTIATSSTSTTSTTTTPPQLSMSVNGIPDSGNYTWISTTSYNAVVAIKWSGSNISQCYPIGDNMPLLTNSPIYNSELINGSSTYWLQLPRLPSSGSDFVLASRIDGYKSPLVIGLNCLSYGGQYISKVFYLPVTTSTTPSQGFGLAPSNTQMTANILDQLKNILDQLAQLLK